jgi:3-oxoacyl-[acyl-carrier protein] reductase
MDLKLKNKIALITGASRGLGYATAHLLAEEGARVIVNSRSLEKLNLAAQKIAAETHAEVLALPGDISDPKVPQFLIEKAGAAWGDLDILITNAGGPPVGRFESLNDQAWYNAIELSLMSHVRLIRAALPYLRRSTDPSVLTITSLSVKQPISNLILSNSIRAATAGLTKSLALELGSEGIRFNSILPSWTETERVTELLGDRAKANGTSIDEELKKQAAESPLGRIATPQEFAAAAVFLVSPVASYITGAMFSVDGGIYKATF